MKTNSVTFFHFIIISVIFSILAFSFFSEDLIVYAQDTELSSIWTNEPICQTVEKILSEKNVSYEQLVWISKDDKERERFFSNFTSDEIDLILSCAKDNLPNLKSEIITKKIGFFEGKNNHEANGISKVITIGNRDYLRFENFEMGFSGDTNPDLHVYLTNNDDFSNSIYLEKLKTKVGSKNYSLLDIDIDNFDTVIIYDEISEEIFATINLTNPSFLIDMIVGFFYTLEDDVGHPKIESEIIYTKTGILEGSDELQSVGRIDTPFEEDDAELQFTSFQISKGYDFHLYATEDGHVKKPGDWVFGPNNSVYVSNTNSNEILRYNANTGEFVDVFIASNDNGGLQGPKDLVFSPDGAHLYVSSFITNEILRYDGTTGKFIDKFVDKDNNFDELKRPMKMILDPDGRYLYVASVGGNQILKYDADTVQIVYAIDNINLLKDQPALENPVSITLDWSGHLYVSNTNSNEILRYNANTGEFVDVFIASNDNGGLQGPKDLVFSPDGAHLYVSSFITNEILRYDGTTGKFIDKFVSAHNGDVSNPKYMIFGPDDHLYVSSVDTGQILSYNGTTGKFMEVFIDRNVGDMKSPRGLMFGPHGDLFVGDGEDNSILRFSDDGVARGFFVEPNQSLEFTINSQIVRNSTSPTDQLNNTDFSVNTIPLSQGLINPEGIAFFPNCKNDTSLVSQNHNFEDEPTASDQCYFIVSSSENDLIFRYVYNEDSESIFKDVFVNDEKIKNPQSIIFGPDDNLYVSSFDTDEILRFDGSTGKFIDVFASSGGLDGPVGMLFDDSTSSLFVSSKNSNQIFKYDSKTGDFLEIFIHNDDDVLQKPESLIKGPDNNLYVSSSETNQILQYRLDDGYFIEKFVSDKSGGLYGPKDLNFNKEGGLCVNSLVTSDIRCYDVDDGHLLKNIDISFNRGLMGKLYSSFGPDGELYVSNPLASTISRYDGNTNLFSSKILSGDYEPLQGPRNLVFGPDKNLYVASNNNHQIMKYDGKSGQFIDVFVGSSSGGLAAPQDLVFHDGYLYVTSNDNHRVLRYDQVTGDFINDFVKSRDGELNEPRGLVFDNKGHLYVASHQNHKILRYNGITGIFEKEINTGDELLNPVGLAFDNKGDLIVSSSGNNQVLLYDVNSPKLNYTVLMSDEYVDDPAGLAMDDENNLLYVGGSESNRILKYDFNTGEINEIKELTDLGKLERPHGLVIQNQELFISNILSASILKFNISNNDSHVFHSGGFNVLGHLGLTFGPNGDIYVISGTSHDILRYAKNGDLLGAFASFPFIDGHNESNLVNGQFQDLVFSPDGSSLYVTSMYTDQVLRFNGVTGEYLGVFIDLDKDGLTHPQNIIYSPDRKLFYINSFDSGSVFAYDVATGNLVTKVLSENTRLNIKNMKFGHDGALYLTVDDYASVLRVEPNSGDLEEFDLGGIYLGSLEQNLLKAKYLLNNINTTRHDTIVVYDRLLEQEFATVSLQDDLIADFLPLPVLWNGIVSTLMGNVDDPVFKSKDIENQAGYFKGLNDVPMIGQVKLAHTEDTVIITLQTFEIRYDQNQYASFYTDEGITKGPRVIACLTTGMENTCNEEQNDVIVLGPLLPNVGDQVYRAKNIDLEKFDTILLYDTLLGQQFAEVSLRDASLFRVSPQLFVDWSQNQFPAFPLLLLGFIAFPLTFDYVRTIFKILFLSLFLSRKKKIQKLPSTSTNKKITIMIPAHNEESGIKSSIEAALKTKYKNKEIIVIDDKSSDNTYAIAKEFSDKGLIKLLHRKQASGSKASALNYGFAYATGDLILCMDGDTLLDKNSLDNAVAYFDDKEVKAVSGNVEILSGDDGIINTLTRAQSYEYLIAIELGRSFTSIFNILLVISGAFGVFRREIFSGTGKFDKDTITEDFDLTLKVRKTKGKIPFVKDSIARTYCPNNWKAWIKQRQRWAHGQMQTLKKHRDLMVSSKSTNRDRIAMFDMWVLDIVMNFLFVVYLIALGPASIIMAVYGNVHILVNVLTLVVITYLVSETLIFVFAVLVSRKYKYFKYLYLVPFMALFYRPFLKIVIFKSYINAARNKEATW